MSLTLTLTSDTKAGTYTLTELDGSLTLTLDTPVSPPSPPTNPGPPVTPPVTGATHVVSLGIVDSAGTAWSVNATVGEDWTVAGQYLPFVDASDNKHPGLRAYVYADCCDVGAVPGSNPSDYAGTLTVSYGGVVVFAPQAVQFWRGCLNTTIRYGKQAPWHAMDRSLFPNYADPGSYKLPLTDFSKFDLSYNGLGVASVPGMASTGSRPDIGYVPQWDVPFVVQPSEAAYAVVRAAADHSGVWPIYFVDDSTGLPFDITKYPNTSLEPYTSSKFPGNPIVAYEGAKGISASPFIWDEAHETGYNFAAAAASGTARDKFHAAVWANAQLTALSPIYRQQCGVWQHYQERGSAWALRSLFLASQVSCMPDYFAAQLEIMRGLAPSTSPLGFQDTYGRPGSNDVQGGPVTGTAIWMENYTRVVVNTIAAKLPAWLPFAQYMGQNVVTMLADARYPLSTLYVHTIKASDGTLLPDWTSVLQATLRGPQGNGTAGAWPEADIAAATDPSVTPQALDFLIRKNTPGYTSNKLGDFIQYVTAPDGYPAFMRAVLAGAVDCGVSGAAQAWATAQAVPTLPDFTKEWGWNIVPKAA